MLKPAKGAALKEVPDEMREFVGNPLRKRRCQWGGLPLSLRTIVDTAVGSRTEGLHAVVAVHEDVQEPHVLTIVHDADSFRSTSRLREVT